MIDKYALSKYVMLCVEIETLEAERESLRMGCVGAVDTARVQRGKGRADPTADVQQQVERIAEKIDRQLGRCLTLRDEIEVAIDSLDDPTERLLMRKRYIEGKRWEQVAVEMNYSINHIWRWHGNILQKMRDNER